jgi:serine/threonine protein phosphatase PrpC
LFGVFDGHGGEQVSSFCEMYLPSMIAEGPRKDVGAALTTAFNQIDDMLEDPEYLADFNAQAPTKFGMFSTPDQVGSTAVVCCVDERVINTANAGDSRAVICRNGKAVDLSKDHKPLLKTEYDRIVKAGGWVGDEERVNDDLALSRALGDLEYKKNKDALPSEQIISGTPDIYTHSRDAQDEFLIVACDGIWDAISSQNAVDFVRGALGNRADVAERIRSGELVLSGIVEDLLDQCLQSHDNCTAILVVFLPYSRV